MLKATKFEIKTAEQAKKLRGIGAKIADKVPLLYIIRQSFSSVLEVNLLFRSAKFSALEHFEELNPTQKMD